MRGRTVLLRRVKALHEGHLLLDGARGAFGVLGRGGGRPRRRVRLSFLVRIRAYHHRTHYLTFLLSLFFLWH